MDMNISIHFQAARAKQICLVSSKSGVIVLFKNPLSLNDCPTF